MNKVIFLFSLLLISSLALTDKEIMQQALNGAFAQNNLPAPTTIVPCFDDATAHKTVVFVGQLLQKAAAGSPTDIINAIQMTKDFIDTIPQPVKDCLDGNQEALALAAKYGIDDKTNFTELEKKVATYVTLHYLTVHKWLGDLNDEWKAGKYNQFGQDAAKDAHQILGS